MNLEVWFWLRSSGDFEKEYAHRNFEASCGSNFLSENHGEMYDVMVRVCIFRSWVPSNTMRPQ